MEMRPKVNLICDSVLYTEHAKIYTFRFDSFVESGGARSSEAVSMLLPTTFKMIPATTAPALAGIGVGGNSIYCPFVDSDYIDATIDMVVDIKGTKYFGSVNTQNCDIATEIVFSQEVTTSA